MKTRFFIGSLAVLTGCTLLAASASAQETVVTFDEGWQGWSGPTGGGGATVIEAEGGNPAAHAHTVFNDFGITFRTSSNPAFIGDFTTSESITVAIDVKVDDISMLGNPVPRSLIVDFRSFSLAGDGYPWTSVWHELALMQTGQDWATYSVTVDPRAIELPEGWGGYGAEDPETFEPMLPPGVSFADVMAATEELAFTTLVPGFLFAFTDHDVRIDNIRIAVGDDDRIFVDGFEID
jgi:hypothetical protein